MATRKRFSRQWIEIGTNDMIKLIVKCNPKAEAEVMEILNRLKSSGKISFKRTKG